MPFRERRAAAAKFIEKGIEVRIKESWIATALVAGIVGYGFFLNSIWPPT